MNRKYSYDRYYVDRYKSIFLNWLKNEGVYEQYKHNFYRLDALRADERLDKLSFDDFFETIFERGLGRFIIEYSFYWTATFESRNYWLKVQSKWIKYYMLNIL